VSDYKTILHTSLLDEKFHGLLVSLKDRDTDTIDMKFAIVNQELDILQCPPTNNSLEIFLCPTRGIGTEVKGSHLNKLQ
jgi:hypothetical protein